MAVWPLAPRPRTMPTCSGSPGRPHRVNASYLFGTPLNATVLAGHIFTVPVVSSSTGKTEVRVTLSDGQIARALLGIALCFATASRKAVLTFREMFIIIIIIIITCKNVQQGR